MSTSNRSLITATISEVLVAGKVDSIGRFFTKDYTAHVTDQDLRGGHDLLRKMIGMYHKAFSDLSAEVDIFLECDGTVAWRNLSEQNTQRRRLSEVCLLGGSSDVVTSHYKT